MEFREFVKNVKIGLEVIVKDNLSDGRVVIRRVRRNNNVRLYAISIVKNGEKAMPTIYLKEYYKMYLSGMPIDEICYEIYGVYEEGIKKFNKYVDVEKLLNYELIKDKIYYKLINYEMNREMLKEHPHFHFLDMAIIFYVMVETFSDGQATTLINNVHLEKWRVNTDELKEISYYNTWKKFPAEIRKMEDIVSDLIIDDLLDDDWLEEDISYGGYTYDEIRDTVKEEMSNVTEIEEMDMYVLTNNIRTNGATCITYPEVLKGFRERLGEDFYVIPSSIHEVILVPIRGRDREEFDEMVKEVNRSELDPVEILSNHVYVYKKEKGRLEY